MDAYKYGALQGNRSTSLHIQTEPGPSMKMSSVACSRIVVLLSTVPGKSVAIQTYPHQQRTFRTLPDSPHIVNPHTSS